jgi:hydrophobic/amphiphilic exporter-1 (mainly G- bacteria), HAE1 family
MQELNVSTTTAGQAVSAAFDGTEATQFISPAYGLTYVDVLTPPQMNTNLDDVTDLPIRASNGDIVRLGDVAHLHWAPTPLVLTRENRMNVVHVSANLAGNANLSDTTKSFLSRVKALKLPKKVTVRPASQGQQDLMGNALQVVLFSLTISIVLVFFLIVALYNSYRTPFVTLFAIPLAVIGAFGALVITRQTLNLYSLIGLLVLVGIVTKNGILLVDYADISRERGLSKHDAIYESAKVRFRPIMMTTVALAFGLFPLALGLEPGGQTRASLGIVMIGGLLSSLILTLFIVPTMYVWFAPERVFEPVTFASER